MRISDWSSDVCSSDLVNLDGLDAMLLPAHVDKIDFAVVEDTSNSIIAFRKSKAIVATADLEEFSLTPITGVSIFLTGERDRFPDIECPSLPQIGREHV